MYKQGGKHAKHVVTRYIFIPLIIIHSQDVLCICVHVYKYMCTCIATDGFEMCWAPRF